MAKIKPLSIALAALVAAGGGYVVLQQTGKIQELEEQLGGGQVGSIFQAAPDLSFIGDLFSNLPTTNVITENVKNTFSGFSDSLESFGEDLLPDLPGLPTLPSFPGLPSLPNFGTTESVGKDITGGVLGFFKGVFGGINDFTLKNIFAPAAEFGANQRKNTIASTGNTPEKNIVNFVKDLIPFKGGSPTANVVSSGSGRTIRSMSIKAKNAASKIMPNTTNTSFPLPSINLVENAKKITEAIKTAPPAF